MSRVDFKTLVIGMLLGVIVMMARGAKVETAFVQRYKISAIVDQNHDTQLYILDHKTNKIYRGWFGGMQSDPPVLEIKTPD